MGFVDGTSVNGTGRGCLADLKLLFFGVKEAKPLDFGGLELLWGGGKLWW